MGRIGLKVIVITMHHRKEDKFVLRLFLPVKFVCNLNVTFHLCQEN